MKYLSQYNVWQGNCNRWKYKKKTNKKTNNNKKKTALPRVLVYISPYKTAHSCVISVLSLCFALWHQLIFAFWNMVHTSKIGEYPSRAPAFHLDSRHGLESPTPPPPPCGKHPDIQLQSLHGAISYTVWNWRIPDPHRYRRYRMGHRIWSHFESFTRARCQMPLPYYACMDC